MSMRVVCGIIVVGVTGPTRVDDLSRSQNRTAVPPFAVTSGRSWRTWGQLLAHIFRESQAATSARVAVCAAEEVGSLLSVSRRGLAFEEIGMVFYPGRPVGGVDVLFREFIWGRFSIRAALQAVG